MASSNVEYHEGKIRSLISLIASIIKSNPRALEDLDYLRACVASSFPAINDRSRCPNCEASMVEYTYNFDAWDAILLLKMAEVVRDRAGKVMTFTEANQVRVPQLETSHAVKCRTTQASKLGLVAQLKGKNGRRVPGVWVITQRGWKALACQPVPAKVKVWRGSIEERFEQMITIQTALKSHVDYVEAKLKKNKAPQHDFRQEAREYDPTRWYDFGYHQGALIPAEEL